MPHTQKSAAERAQDIVVAQGGTYAKDKWVETKPVPSNTKGQDTPARDTGR